MTIAIISTRIISNFSVCYSYLLQLLATVTCWRICDPIVYKDKSLFDHCRINRNQIAFIIFRSVCVSKLIFLYINEVKKSYFQAFPWNVYFFLSLFIYKKLNILKMTAPRIPIYFNTTERSERSFFLMRMVEVSGNSTRPKSATPFGFRVPYVSATRRVIIFKPKPKVAHFSIMQLIKFSK